MQRRKARDDLMDSLELGRTTNYSTSIPMKKLTKMKFVKYLILILIAVFIHTTYRLMWKTNDVSDDTPQTNIIKDREDLEKPVDTFKQRLKDVDSLQRNNIDSLQRGPIDIDQRNNEDLREIPREQDDNMLQNKAEENMKKLEETIDRKTKEEIEKLSLLRDKQERLENLRKSVEEVKQDLNAIEGEIQAPDQKNVIQPEILTKDIKEDRAIETLELEKERIIENKIAEVMNEMKVPEKVTEKVDKAKEKNEIEQEMLRLKHPEKFAEKPATKPAPNEEFIKKADKIVEKIQPDKSAGTIITDHKHGEPVLVTAVTSKTFDQIKQLVFSLQKFNPKDKIYIFDLDLTDRQRMHLMAACNVRIREFWSNLFPKFISNWDHYHWRPLVIQTALAEFGHIIWINPGNVVIASTLPDIAKETKSLKMRIIGQNQQYTTYAVTHRQMYKYLPTEKKKLYNSPHFEIQAILLHSTEEIMENFMKLIVACAMEKDCMAPESTKWQCDFDFSGKEYANCHRYDESAMNIAIKNWYNYDVSSVVKISNIFRSFDPDEKLPLKMCRDERDMKPR